MSSRCLSIIQTALCAKSQYCWASHMFLECISDFQRYFHLLQIQEFSAPLLDEPTKGYLGECCNFWTLFSKFQFIWNYSRPLSKCCYCQLMLYCVNKFNYLFDGCNDCCLNWLWTQSNKETTFLTMVEGLCVFWHYCVHLNLFLTSKTHNINLRTKGVLYHMHLSSSLHH